MNQQNLTLYLEINHSEYVFFVGENVDQNDSNILYKCNIPLSGIENNRISDFDKIYGVIKENIYLIEKKFNYTFKEIILILENFNPTFINLSGYKKLNGSQISKENITYVLNTLKSCVDEIETKRTVLHIFNTKYNLDNKKIENLPIGLFGDFYSHELSFTLINNNDYKNIKNIFDQINLKIKKILLQSYVKGAFVNEKNKNVDTFFLVKINNYNSKIFYFENSSLKYEQDFKFGYDIIIKDISKITHLKKRNIEKILNNIEFGKKISADEVIEKEFFLDENFRKIKKKLLLDIISARIEEIFELLISKNINCTYNINSPKRLFLEQDYDQPCNCLKEAYKSIFSASQNLEVIPLEIFSDDDKLKMVNKLVHFGWKKEAIPITQVKKTLIAKFFDAIFG